MSNQEKQILRWPDGSVYRITRSTEDTAGERLEMELELPPNGWAPRPHVHPLLTEEYEVLEGSLDVSIEGEWRTLHPGEAASVPPGAVHTFRTRSEAVHLRNVHHPPLDFEPYITKLCLAANERKLGDLTGFKSLLVVAVLIREYPKHSRAPGRVLNSLVPALAALGRALGFGQPPRH